VVSLPEQVGTSIASRRLFSPHQRIVVAVSGGVDSMVLLHVLAELSRDSGWKLIVAHLNHQLRGRSSLADEKLVRRTAAALRLPMLVERANVRRFAKTHGLSIEMAARQLRHDFLARAAIEHKATCVALAHHLDDQIELFFLRLLRGGGSQGLAGMKFRNSSPGNPAITLVRPFLGCQKNELRQYAVQRGIKFREDSTNSFLDMQRNRIRNELLPLLEQKYQVALNQTVSRVMDILGAESDFVNSVAESWLRVRQDAKQADSICGGEESVELDKAAAVSLTGNLSTSAFERLPVALQRRCIQLQLFRLGIVASFDLVEHLRLRPDQPIEVRRDGMSLGRTGTTHITEQPGRLFLRVAREPGGLVRTRPFRPGTFRQGHRELHLDSGQGQIDWEGMRFEWRISLDKGDGIAQRVPETEFFDADTVGPAVIIRHWHRGDRFQPIGMSRPVKLQDLFINQKVPRERRHGLAVVATPQGRIIWVEGLRIAERFKLTKATIRRLHWAWQRL
jgi:tRNA(Ile)-lysidine synthase